MPLIDEFTAVLCNLSLIEITASGPTTAAQAYVRFIDCGDDATLLETIRTGQSSQTAPTTTIRALVATCVVANSYDGKASPAVAVEMVRRNSRRDISKSSTASRLSDWAAVAAAWLRSLARGVCGILKWFV